MLVQSRECCVGRDAIGAVVGEGTRTRAPFASSRTPGTSSAKFGLGRARTGALLGRHRRQAAAAIHPATGEVRRWTMPERIACFALRENGGLIVAFASGFALYDLDRATIDWIARPEARVRHDRFNEGKCDRKGRFWAGMDDLSRNTQARSIASISTSRCSKVLDGIGISNSTVWSLEDDAFSISPTRSMARSSLRLRSRKRRRSISNRRQIVDLKGTGIGPDSRTAEIPLERPVGRLAPRRYAPDDRLDRTVDLRSRSRPVACSAGRV